MKEKPTKQLLICESTHSLVSVYASKQKPKQTLYEALDELVRRGLKPRTGGKKK